MTVNLLRVPVAYFYYCFFDIEADLPGDSMIRLSIRLFFHFFIGCTARHVGCYFSIQGSNPCPLHWTCRVLATGPQGESWHKAFINNSYYLLHTICVPGTILIIYIDFTI